MTFKNKQILLTSIAWVAVLNAIFLLGLLLIPLFLRPGLIVKTFQSYYDLSSLKAIISILIKIYIPVIAGTFLIFSTRRLFKRDIPDEILYLSFFYLSLLSESLRSTIVISKIYIITLPLSVWITNYIIASFFLGLLSLFFMGLGIGNRPFIPSELLLSLGLITIVLVMLKLPLQEESLLSPYLHRQPGYYSIYFFSIVISLASILNYLAAFFSNGSKFYLLMALIIALLALGRIAVFNFSSLPSYLIGILLSVTGATLFITAIKKSTL